MLNSAPEATGDIHDIKSVTPPAKPAEASAASTESPAPTTSKHPRKKLSPVMTATIAGLTVVVGLGLGALAYLNYESQTIADFLTTKAAQRQAEMTQTKKLSDLSAKYLSDGSENPFADSEEESISPPKKVSIDDLSVDKVVEPFRKFESNLLIFEDAFTVYTDLVEQHAQATDKQAQQTQFLMGRSKNLLAELSGARKRFYELDIDDNQDSLGSLALQHSMLLFSEDQARIGLFMLKTRNLDNPEIVADNFSLLAPLEQYTHNDFKYKNHDYLAQYYPAGLEKLEATRTFFKNYYLAVKDLAAEDLESAAYKFSRLSDDSAKVRGTDFDTILKSRNADTAKNHQDVVKELLSEYQLSKQLAQNLKFRKVDWRPGDLACSAVMYKLSGYAALKDNYPEVSSTDELYTTLEEMSPSLAEIEPLIKEQVVIRKEADHLYLTCKSLNLEWTYHIKDDEDSAESDN